MKQHVFQEKYPLYSLEIDRDETSFKNVDEIIAYLKGKIDAHKIACYITVFDHLSHTKALPDGKVAPEILEAKNLVFCFGTHLPNTHVMAVRPRSIGVCETDEGFTIDFLEAPMELANTAMEEWAKSVRNLK